MASRACADVRTAVLMATMLAAVRARAAPVLSAEFLASALIDLATLSGLALLGGRRRWASAAVGTLVIGYATLVFWHGYFLDIASGFHLSPAAVSLGTIGFFARDLVSRKAWVAFAGFWSVAGLAWWWRRGGEPGAPAGERSMSGRPAVAAGLLILGGAIAALPGLDHPLSALVTDLRRMASAATVADPRLTQSVDYLNRRRTDTWQLSSRFERVLVFVMEGVTRAQLDSILPRLPEDGFFRRVDRSATKYSGYFTSDQESRTARMAMLHSLMIPYEAYTEGWEDRFGPLFASGGMVRLFRENGWRTAVAIPLLELPWDLRSLPWDSVLHATPADLERAEVTCLAPTPFDRGCEDDLLRDAVAGVIDGDRRVFLFQPFLVGHTSKWEESLGVHRIAYYDRYLERLRSTLEERGLLAGTLMVVTADHGPRTETALGRPAAYEVPLWLIARGFPDERRVGFFAHPELRDLLLSTLRTGAPVDPPSRPLLMAMGPTGRNTFACLWPDGFARVRIRGVGVGSVIGPTSTDRPRVGSCVTTFFDYRRTFGALR